MKTPEEAKRIIDQIGKEFFESVQRNTSELSDKERWIIVARVTNGLFASIYEPTYKLTHAKIQAAELELSDKEKQVDGIEALNEAWKAIKERGVNNGL